MPEELQQALDTALSALREHHQCALLPYYRWTIYNALGPLNSLQTRFTRVRLALLSAQKVQHIWQQELPGDPLPEQLIMLAKMVLRDEVLREDGRAHAESALDHVARLASSSAHPDEMQASARAQSALLAATEALFAACGTYTFATPYNYKGDTDIELDPWSTDAALYAAMALSGAVWHVTQDYEQRTQFWQWWLLEAVPSLYSCTPNQGT
jgi:hypothetical protein